MSGGYIGIDNGINPKSSEVSVDTSGFSNFLSSAEDTAQKVFNKLDTLSEVMIFKGDIAVNSDFPTSAAVKNGWVYKITADVTDDDPAKTNTGLSFLDGAEIAWDGSTWIDLGNDSLWKRTGTVLEPITAGDTITADEFTGDLNGTINTATTGTTQSPNDNSTKIATTAYVDALGCNPEKTYTVSPSGGDYTTIQSALDANATGGELFVVYPGTYANDTINFTANEQTVMTPSKGNNVIVTNSAQVVEAGDFTGCNIKNIRINFTPTTAINGIEVNNGSLSLDSAGLDLTTSSAIAGATQPALLAVTGTGALITKFGEFTYQHTGNTTNGIKALFNVATGGTLDCLRPCESSMTNSGTAAATALAIDAGTAVIRITNACNFVITDTASAVVAGLGYLGGSGDTEFEYCKIKIVGGGSNNCYGIYNSGTGSIRSTHNIIEVVSGATNYGFFTGASATTVSTTDDIRAADGNVNTGNFIEASSNVDGAFTLRRADDPHLRLINITKEDIDGGRESSLVFKGLQSGGEETTLAKIQASHDGTSDDQKGDLIFLTNDGSDGDAPTERLRLDSAGNVGIGTSSIPSVDKLSILGGLVRSSMSKAFSGNPLDASTFSGYVSLNTNNANGDLTGLAMYTNSSYGAGTGIFAKQISSTTADLVFYTGTGIASSNLERMRIDYSGNVGIGGSPAAKLHIAGNSATSDPVLVQSDTSSRATISFRTGTASNRFWVGERQNDGSGFAITYGTSSATDNGLLMDTSGNVGIGGSPSQKLDIIGASDNSCRFIPSSSASFYIQTYSTASTNGQDLFLGSRNRDVLSLDVSSGNVTVENGSLLVEYTSDTGSQGIKLGNTADGFVFSDYNVYIGIDNDNSTTANTFNVYHDGDKSKVLFTVGEDGNVTIPGYTTLGTGAPAIKCKKVTGLTASAEGSNNGTAHGLTTSKIIGYSVYVEHTTGYKSGPGSPVAGYEYGASIENTTASIFNAAGNSVYILGKPFTFLIWYEE